MTIKLLLVEDDPEIREIITDYFTEKSGGTFRLDSARSGEEGRQKCLEQDYDLVGIGDILAKYLKERLG